ncbi:MAG: sensor histidine kinase, partial [Sphingomonadales bacterium]
MAVVLAPKQGLRALLARLRGRPDSEHEMSFNRVTNALVALTLVIVAGLDPHITYVLLAFVALSLAVFCQLLLDDRARPARLGLMIVADMAMICFYMGASGTYGAGFWPLLLWTILGNGFRFGRTYLFAATGVAVAGFAAVIAWSPFWREHLPLSIGLLVGLVAVPLYYAKLIRKLSRATEAAEQANRAKSYFL